MKRLKNLKKKLIIIATVMLLVLCSALPIFADGINENAWYNPNAVITMPTLPTYTSYYFEIEYTSDGVDYSYQTTTSSSSSNSNIIDGSNNNFFLNFGSTNYEIIQFYSTYDRWGIRKANGDIVELSNEDIKMKLVVLDANAEGMDDFIAWFNDNYSEIVVPSDNVVVATSFIEILTSGISNLASGIGSGVNSFVGDLFLNASGNGLSTFGFVVAIFGGLALAVGLTKLIFEWIRSIGN